MLNAIGEDPKRQGLKRTPLRAANALWFFTKGYRQDLKGIIWLFIQKFIKKEKILYKRKTFI